MNFDKQRFVTLLPLSLVGGHSIVKHMSECEDLCGSRCILKVCPARKKVDEKHVV